MAKNLILYLTQICKICRKKYKIVKIKMPITVQEKRIKKIRLYHLIFEGDLTEKDQEEFKKLFNGFIDKGPFCAIFDIRKIKSASPSLILEQAKFMKEYEPRAKDRLISTSILLDDGWMQKMLKSLFMIKKPIAPNFISSCIEESEEFSQDHISLFKIQQRRLQKTQ